MFGIDWALLAGLGGFVATLVIGGPLTRALAEPDELRARTRKPRSETRDRRVVTVGFTPLDLGADPMQWPSERPWPPGMPTAPWPSQTWDDEHFGSFWRGANPPPAEDAPQSSAPRPSAAVAPPTTPPVRPRQDPTPRSPERAARRRSSLRRPTERPTNGQAPSPSPRTPDSQARLPATKPPPREELEQLIATVGLAGTVQQIMQRTGWDFRKAAHYLARVRQDG